MVFINVCLFQKTILHLISHHSFTHSCTSSILNHNTQSSFFFFFSSFKHYLYTAAQPHHPLISPLALLIFVSQATLALFIFFVLSFSVSTEWCMNGLWSSCIFDKTNRADILPWTRVDVALYLHWSTVAVQVKTLTPNWNSSMDCYFSKD